MRLLGRKKAEETAVTVQGPRNVNPERLIGEAIEKGLSVETMKELLAMRRELKEEWAKEQYFAALARFQTALPAIQKLKEVLNKDWETVRYRYAPLDVITAAVAPLFERHGFSYMVRASQEKSWMTAECIIHHIGGHSETTSFSVPIDAEAYMSAAQKVAAALTYSKRYAFCNGFGIMTTEEDPDGALEAEPLKPVREVRTARKIPLGDTVGTDATKAPNPYDKPMAEAPKQELTLEAEESTGATDVTRGTDAPGLKKKIMDDYINTDKLPVSDTGDGKPGKVDTMKAVAQAGTDTAKLTAVLKHLEETYGKEVTT